MLNNMADPDFDQQTSQEMNTNFTPNDTPQETPIYTPVEIPLLSPTEIRAARAGVDPVTSENLQAPVIYRPSVYHSFETAQEVDSEARERNLQGEEKNLSMAQSNSNEHVARSLDYESQAKDSPEVITDRLATPRKDASKKRRGKRPTPSPAVQKIHTGGNKFLSPTL